MKKLFKIEGFLPFLAIAFLNATVDLAHKITIQNVLLKSYSGDTLVILSAIINAMILLPFIFLFSPAGFINDKFSKTKVIQTASLVAVGLCVVILFSYIFGFFELAFFMTLALAIQSAIYSPAKYALIKNLVGTNSLGIANGIIQALTIVAILLSSFAFSWIFELSYGGNSPQTILPNIYIIGVLLTLLSMLEAFFAFKLPFFKANSNKESFSYKKYFSLRYLNENLKIVKSDKNIWLSIIGLSVFWGISQVLIAGFPAHFKSISANDNALVIQAILAISTIGLIIGSSIAGKMSKDHIELGIVPIGAFGIFISLLFFATLKSPFGLGLSSLFFGFFGGLFIVPLNATIQFFAPQKSIGKILAGNNFIQNISMICFLALSIVFVKLDISTTGLFLFACFVSLVGSFYAILQLPHLFTRLLLLPILKTHYNFNVKGLKNLPQSGGVLLLGNHISWIDWLVLQVASPRAIKFVMYREIYNQWYLNWFLRLFNVIPIGVGASKESLKAIQTRLDNGEVVALFPEGHISYNGQLGEFQKGFELALRQTKNEVKVVPFYLRGLWGTSFSRATKHYKELTNKRGKRELIVAFGKPLSNQIDALHVKKNITQLSFNSWESFIKEQKPFTHQWLHMAKLSPSSQCMVDSLGKSLTNAKFLTAVLLFATLFKKSFKKRHIGVMLPNSSIAIIVNMALFILGKVPINLNYTQSKEALQSALDKALIDEVITSSKFLEKLEQKGFNFQETLGEKVKFVEDLATKISLFSKIKSTLVARFLPTSLIEMLYFANINLEDTATILFSSGSEGEPKGIELSHKNLLTNIKQISELLNFRKDDVILNSLPIFHSFGLTVTTLLPLCEGIKIVSTPDPTDGLMAGKMAFKHNATILFGTSTFFRLYTKNKRLHPLMFDSLRMVVAGAEKLKPEIKEAFRLKFGLEIYEGYGTTETAPVVAVNMPNMLNPQSLKELTFNKYSSVGMPLPGTIVKIVDPKSLKELPTNEDGLIIIGGGQVMKGYLEDEIKTDEVIVRLDGIRYYKTGDKGHIDEDGFVYITDRYSRFAKIGGEMVSLGSVEESIARVLSDECHFVAVAVPDSKKGEAVVLLVQSTLGTHEIKEQLKNSNLPSLMQPSFLFLVDVLPTLGSGKVDFKKAKTLALSLIEK